MALSTYDELQAAIAAWSFNRTDLPAEDLITLGECRLARDLKLRATESDATLTGVVDSRFIALPSGFVSPVRCWIELGTGRDELAKLTPGVTTLLGSGQPEHWTIEGENLAFERPCNSAYTFTLRYFGRLTLSDASPTNWLLTNHPDAYLSAALVEAALWVADDEQATRWQARYEAAISGIANVESRSRSAPRRTDIPALMGADTDSSETFLNG